MGRGELECFSRRLAHKPSVGATARLGGPRTDSDDLTRLLCQVGVLMNNAAIGGPTGTSWSGIDNWHKMFDVNLFGCVPLYASRRAGCSLSACVCSGAWQRSERPAHVCAHDAAPGKPGCYHQHGLEAGHYEPPVRTSPRTRCRALANLTSWPIAETPRTTPPRPQSSRSRKVSRMSFGRRLLSTLPRICLCKLRASARDASSWA